MKNMIIIVTSILVLLAGLVLNYSTYNGKENENNIKNIK